MWLRAGPEHPGERGRQQGEEREAAMLGCHSRPSTVHQS